MTLPHNINTCIYLFSTHRVSQGQMGDVYDCKLWSEMQSIEGRSFLEVPINLCLAINIDFMKMFPFQGGVYLVILNLPRSERFKSQNVILAGMIPNEPAGDINSLSCFSMTTTIRAVVLCLMCDLPATRKSCGFASYNAYMVALNVLNSFQTKPLAKRFSEHPLGSHIHPLIKFV